MTDETMLQPQDLEPVEVREIDEPGPDAPDETTEHGESASDGH